MSKLALPQNESDPALKSAREEQLNASRQLYYYKWYRGLLPKNDQGPVTGLDTPGPEWIRTVLKSSFGIRANFDKVVAQKKYSFTNANPSMPSARIAGLIRTLQTSPLRDYYGCDPGPITGEAGLKKKSISDYKELFTLLKLPAWVTQGRELSDAVFSRSFIAGSNPHRIRCLKSIPSNFALSTELLRKADFERKSQYFANDTIQAAITEGRVFLVDYSFMSDLKPGAYTSSIPKYTYSAMAAFAVPPKSAGSNRPFSVFAIKGGQSSDSIIFTPDDNWSWMIAKGMVNASHYTFHECVSHLGLTHIVMESVVTSMRRHLAKNHPIYHLLTPHCEGTRSINHSAYNSLIQPGWTVDRLIGTTIQDAYQLIARERLSFDFAKHYLPTFLRTHKLDAASGADLPEYPYRDDAILHWNAIANWAKRYVNIYYARDSEVAADYELQNWAKELSDPTVDQGGALPGFGKGGKISSLEELADICTMIMFTAGPQHASVNFPQRTDMMFVPSAPLAGYLPEIKRKGHTESDFLSFLPPVDIALFQAATAEQLGSVFYTQLGQYPTDHFTDPQAKEALSTFVKELQSIESQVNERNKSGSRLDIPYVALLPSKVPQSINI